MSRGREKKKPKQPRDGAAIDGTKRPAEESFASDGRMSYRFGMCDEGGEWAWSWDALAEHLPKLVDFEHKTWDDIICDGSVGAKRIPRSKLPSAAQSRLRRIQKDDTDALWELRVGNKPRFWGQRHGSVMCFIWWDENHTVFKRNR